MCKTNFIATQTDYASAKIMTTSIIDMAKLDSYIIRTYIGQITDLFTVESHHIRAAALTVLCSFIEQLLLFDDLDLMHNSVVFTLGTCI